MSYKYQELIDLIVSKPVGEPVEVPRMPTLERHSVFAGVRQNLKAMGFALRVKTDGQWHYVRRVPIADNDSPVQCNNSPDPL